MTNKFKIGDRVVSTKLSYTGSEGVIQKINEREDLYYVKFETGFCNKNGTNLQLVTNEKLNNLTEEIAMKNKNKKSSTWLFQAPSDYLIDYERIAGELSYKHPVAVVKRGKVIHNILIHKSIINKAQALNYYLAPCLKKLTCTCYEVVNNQEVPSSSDDNERLGEWLEWVKEVKNAQHVQVFVKELQTINVSIPL